MISLLAAVSMTLVTAPVPAPQVQRQPHDHTIYIVAGSADELRKFDEEVASNWEGGILLSKDESRGAYRYWAFSDRTAPQARHFIIGAMMSGLALDLEAYDEQQLFPVQRSRLDEIATSCRLAQDPFFISPAGELKVSFASAEAPAGVSCAREKLKASALPDILQEPTG